MLLGSARAKAACKMLVKLTPGVKITNIFNAQPLQAQIPKVQKIQSCTSVICANIAARKMLVKLTHQGCTTYSFKTKGESFRKRNFSQIFCLLTC